MHQNTRPFDRQTFVDRADAYATQGQHWQAHECREAVRLADQVSLIEFNRCVNMLRAWGETAAADRLAAAKRPAPLEY